MKHLSKTIVDNIDTDIYNLIQIIYVHCCSSQEEAEHQGRGEHDDQPAAGGPRQSAQAQQEPGRLQDQGQEQGRVLLREDLQHYRLPGDVPKFPTGYTRTLNLCSFLCNVKMTHLFTGDICDAGGGGEQRGHRGRGLQHSGRHPGHRAQRGLHPR